MTRLDTLQDRLEELAYEETDNFCYGCYKVVEGEFCPTCHSDDFMRHLKGVGVEYGTDWVIEHLIKDSCEPIDAEALFEELLEELYPAYEIGYSTFTAADILKELDPTAFRIGAQEHIGSLIEDGEIYECDGEYYQVFEIEQELL